MLDSGSCCSAVLTPVMAVLRFWKSRTEKLEPEMKALTAILASGLDAGLHRREAQITTTYSDYNYGRICTLGHCERQQKRP